MTFWDWMTANEDVLKPGKGLFCPLHIVMIGMLAIWLVCSYFIFKKHTNFSKKFIHYMIIVMLVSRIFRMIFRVSVGADSLFEAMPWQLCHIMCFCLSIAYFTKTDNYMSVVCIFSFFGGVLTFLFGDYYKFNILTFYDIESILLHIFLPTIAIYMYVNNKVKITIKNIMYSFVFILLISCYAEIGNTIFKDTNFLFIRENALPFNLFNYHILSYLFYIFCIMISMSIFVLIKKYKTKYQLLYELNLTNEVDNTSIELSQDQQMLIDLTTDSLPDEQQLAN